MHPTAKDFVNAASEVIFDREHEILLALCCFLAGGHLLIEDTPGVGKTTLVKLIARLLGLDFKRIQFTNDLLPSDILGTNVFNPNTQTFNFHQGPLFAQLVLGDELNRASARTQSATLQAMEEREVTIDGKTYPLPQPFFFVGTLNPRDQSGTANLPESQIDRFLMRLNLRSPERSTQRKLLTREQTRHAGGVWDSHLIHPVITIEMFKELQKSVAEVTVSEAVREYILDLSDASHQRGWPISPRSILGLQRAAQAWALLSGRKYTMPDDVQTVVVPVLSHRLSVFGKDNLKTGEGLRMAREILEMTRVR
jgi:MoxR-like ATPase